jgi:histidine triad (HIT) family protein
VSTIFKQIIDKKIPAKIVHEDELCLAFNDIEPQAPVHILIIPKQEFKTLNDFETTHAELLGHLLLTAAEIAKKQGFANDGYRTVINTNPRGGQTVYHLHVHLLAGRQMTWPPG